MRLRLYERHRRERLPRKGRRAYRPSVQPTQMTHEQFKTALQKQVQELSNLIIKKNERYGNSALTPPTLCPVLTAKEGIQVRLGDKFARMQRLIETDEVVAEEPLRDTVRDIIGYCLLWLVADEAETAGGDSSSLQEF